RQATLPALYTFTSADQGVHDFTATLRTAGVQSLTAFWSGTQVNAQAIISFDVLPVAAVRLQFADPAARVTAGSAFGSTLKALDPYGNVATGYTGTGHFTSTDGGGATLPADYTFTAGDAGAHSFSATLVTAGPQTLTATDAATAGIAGSRTLNVVAAGANHFTITGPTSTTA